MVQAIGIVLAAVAAVWVALPFLSRDADVTEAPARRPDDRERWERQKHEAYAAIKEAEFDLQMGKLSDVDFAVVRDKYGKLALEAIAALDNAGTVGGPAKGRKPTRIAYCPTCGHTVPPRANFCPGCGGSMLEAVA